MAGLEEESAKPSETAAQPSGDRADALPNAGGAAAEETERPEKKKDGGDDDDEDEEDEFEDVAPPPPLAAAATSTSTSSFFRLDPSSEALAEAATLKSSGNDVFGQGEYAEAVVVYKKALEKLGDEIEEEEEEEKDGYRSRHGGFVFIESVQKVQNSRLGKDERALHSLGIFDRASGVDVWNYVFSLGRAINRAIASRGTDDGDGERTNGSVGGSATTAAATIITLILESLKHQT